jgi:5'-nucleotidase
MPRPLILLTNDDGAESPALVPFAHALMALGDVRVVVPDRERSWVGKAISRFEDLSVTAKMDGGIEVVGVSGFPADCVQLGVFNLFDRVPDLVVSGINIGANHGEAFVVCSGTVGAALEAAIVGVPALAFSAVSVGDWSAWSAWSRTPEADPTWRRLAAIASEITADVLEGGFPGGVDVMKVEMPGDATAETPRMVAPLSPIRYGRLFDPAPGGGFHHRFPGGLAPVGPVEGTDWMVVRNGAIAITALQLNMTARLEESSRLRLERP